MRESKKGRKPSGATVAQSPRRRQGGTGILVRASVAYSNSAALRAGIQFLPGGGAIDAIITSPAAHVFAERLEHVERELMRQARQFRITMKNAEPGGPLWDLYLKTGRQALETRSPTKRKRLASIIAQQMKRDGPWESADEANRLVAELEDAHVEVLRFMHSHEGRAVALQNEPDIRSLDQLAKEFPSITPPEMRLVCARLVAAGLLADAGISSQREHAPAMTYFRATNASRWFLEWLPMDSGDPSLLETDED